MIAEKLRKFVSAQTADKLETVIIAVFVLIIGLGILRIPAVQAPDWYDDLINFVAKALTTFGVAAFVLYLVVDLLLDEKRSPVNALLNESNKADKKQGAQAPLADTILPFSLIYKQVNESDIDFLKRSIDALKKDKCCVVIFYSEPYCVIKFADNSTIRLFRGEAPWEQGSPQDDDLSQQSYQDYMNYVSSFVEGFRTHLKRCAFESPEIDDIEIVAGATLPAFMPSNFAKKRAMSFVFALFLPLSSLFSQSAMSQIYDIMRGAVREVPDKGNVVEFVFDNGAVEVVADGKSTYEVLMKIASRQLSKYNNAELLGVFLSGKEVVSRRAVEEISSLQPLAAKRIKIVSDNPTPPRQSTDDNAKESDATTVDIRPDAVGNKDAILEKIPPPPGQSAAREAERAVEHIDSLKRDAVGFFETWWSVIVYAFHAFGRFILFLMILSRMLASQAAGEMVATFAGRVWGGQLLLNALIFLSTWQMVLVWLASGYLLTSFAIFLANLGVNFVWWFILTVAASLLLVRISHWFVVSPRDVIDAGSNRGGGGMVPRG